MLTTWACVTEALHLLYRAGGHRLQDQLWEWCERKWIRVAGPFRRDRKRLRLLMSKYASAPMDLADATLVVTAERTGLRRVFTLDRHFRTYLITTGIPSPLSPDAPAIDRALYPFTGHHFDVGGGTRLHYLDEGRGPPVVMLHGNPTWSFYYRNLVLALRDRYRCVVPDHVGCGLSDKPPDSRYPYSLERRVADLTALLDHLRLDRDVTLVLHDWGGMIGAAWATRFPERVKRLVVLNTAAFHLPKSKRLPLSLWVGRNTAAGALLIRGANLFCRAAARWCVTRRPLPPDVRRMYLTPYDSWANRVAVLRFVQTIPLRPADAGYDIVSATERRLHLLRGRPVLVCWGMRDFVFDEHFLRMWEQHFPAAEVHRYADAGHYVLEDAGEEVTAHVGEFLKRTD
jgi:haloalkane dehalogenase